MDAVEEEFSLPPKKDTPLHIAASAREPDRVKSIIRKKPIFAWYKNQYGLTPLHIASALGHLEIVNTLLGVGSESLCRLQDDEGRTPLHYAAMNGKADVSRRLAKECRETLATLTTDKDTPLYLALKSGNVDTIEALVEELGWLDKFIFKRTNFVILPKDSVILRMMFGSIPINMPSRADKKTLQVVAILMATMSFEAIVHPPESIWKQDMKLNYRCLTANKNFTSSHYCPTANFLSFLLLNTACFVFSSLLLSSIREGARAEALLRLSMIALGGSYFVLLESMTPEDYMLFFISNFVFIILYGALLLDSLRMASYWITRRKPNNPECRVILFGSPETQNNPR